MKNKTYLFIRYKFLQLVFALGNSLGINKKSISVLCYHGFSLHKYNKYTVHPAEFSKQLKTIKERTEFISVEEMMSIVDGKKFVKNSVVLTIDDGYEDVLSVFPILRKYNIPVMLFVLANPEKADWKELDYKGKLLKDKDIRMLYKAGWAIGCHSATHKDMSKLSSKQIRVEIIDAKKILEKRLGFSIEYFAYPKGAYSQNIIEAVKSAGYKAAFSVLPGVVTRKSNRYLLPRTVVKEENKTEEIPIMISKTTQLMRVIVSKYNLWPIIARMGM